MATAGTAAIAAATSPVHIRERAIASSPQQHGWAEHTVTSATE
jgi:hypothetical protein